MQLLHLDLRRCRNARRHRVDANVTTEIALTSIFLAAEVATEDRIALLANLRHRAQRSFHVDRESRHGRVNYTTTVGTLVVQVQQLVNRQRSALTKAFATL